MSNLLFTRVPFNPVSLGLVCNFIAHYPPFDGYEFGQMVKSLRYQLEQQTHLIGSIDDAIVAYVGWIVTSSEIAEAWVANNGPLNPYPGGPAVAVTVLATRSSSHILPLIKEAKLLNLDKSVYWKRDFIDARGAMKRAVRKRDA
ncbi:hypothetical protein EOA32_23800 [Mesorhizobium sp. M1A.F.Ca.ET.072.01.1.1]|uniref:hypothetical protein n=1 Tax=Mesorhizobium sp. M1A.F.Ca.ET.072.01.1.1 TaxID=2496753 RepID=UPI000FD27F01|nr:hypothetical protein [Mesorhizobium sp. M1A.F.Ca.ET.072.01.1.1]RUW49051.1 hypothetical protein EOA32_23800 [Mesorhizobium sp. M1A.F.Ca.ET.072.01.1.1]TIV02354.1 MAG: hypothetical protein E5W04_13745 [Mesorhizobium sp.]